MECWEIDNNKAKSKFKNTGAMSKNFIQVTLTKKL